MKTKSSPHEKLFVPGSSRRREGGVTLRLAVARDEQTMLAMGARIKELREASGLKQQYIADQCGVQLRTYQFWQAGSSPPSQESLEKLAELFGVTTKYILRGETPSLASDTERLDRIEAKLDQLLAAIGVDNAGRGDLSDQIIRTVEKALNQRASEVGRSPKRADRAHPEQPHQGAA